MTPSATLLAYTQINPDLDLKRFPLKEPLDLIEYAGRWDYGANSIKKMGDRGIIGRWLGMGEESMIEMVDAAFFIECSRVVTHEIVRHRIASFQQESQRYVDYSAETVEDLFYFDPSLSDDAFDLIEQSYKVALDNYNSLREDESGKKQIARYLLPNGTRARIIMKTNLREWRHILKLRMHKSAQPEMQLVAKDIHSQLLAKFPEVFSDIDGLVRAAR